jgi:single-stranded-DNA-specific exonuclease
LGGTQTARGGAGEARKTSVRRKAAPGRWALPEVLGAAETALLKDFGTALQLSPVCSRILLRRGYTTVEAAADFLARRMDLLHDPMKLPDMAVAVARIAEAVEKNQRIVLFGDYDVDGVTSTALLARFFRVLSRHRRSDIHVHPCIPERKDGYGLSPAAMKRLLELKPNLVITLDNGTASFDAVVEFKKHGIDCVVVDHHHIGEALPPAVAAINPKRRDNGCAYPFTELCGAGVTFKLAWALAVHYSQNKRVSPEFRAFLLDAQALAALGTLADVVPLVDENRVLAFHGLTALEKTQMPGLRALIDICKIEGRPRCSDVTFRIAPRINAAGRCSEAAEALELLLTDDAERARELAAILDGHNADRQAIELNILDSARQQALEQLEAAPDCRAFVLASPDWHIGVIGIVASRIVEEFHRPTLMLCINTETTTAQGSGRSIRKLHLYEALASQREYLKTFGGHAAAAGLTLHATNIDPFRAGFQSAAGGVLTAEDIVPVQRVDEQVELGSLTAAFCADLEKFEPCGAGNPRPILAATGVGLPAPPKLFGTDERHLSFFARQGNATRRVVAFNGAEHFNALCDLAHGGTIDLAFRPQLNSFRGETTVELHLEAFRKSGLRTEE